MIKGQDLRGGQFLGAQVSSLYQNTDLTTKHISDQGPGSQRWSFPWSSGQLSPIQYSRSEVFRSTCRYNSKDITPLITWFIFYSRTLQHLNYWHPPPFPSKFYFYFSTMLHLTNSDTLPNSNFTVSPPGFSSFSQVSLSCTCFVFVMWNIEWSTVNTLTSQVAAFSERDTQVGVLSTKFISEKLGEITIKFVCWLSLSQRWDAL